MFDFPSFSFLSPAISVCMAPLHFILAYLYFRGRIRDISSDLIVLVTNKGAWRNTAVSGLIRFNRRTVSSSGSVSPLS